MGPTKVSMNLLHDIVRLPFFKHLEIKVERMNLRSPKEELTQKVSDIFNDIASHVKKFFSKEEYGPVIKPFAYNDINRYKALNELNIRRENNNALIKFAKILKDEMPLITESSAEEIRAFLIANSEDVLKITYLDCDDCEMGCLPPEIGLFKNLKYFYATNNGLKSLPREFFLLKKLEDVYFAENNFTEIDDRICALPMLKTLDFSANKIKKLPEALSLVTSLVELALDKNELESIDYWIIDLINLEELSLTLNKLTKVPKGIEKLKKLRNLWLNKNEITTLPEWLGGLTALELLFLDNNLIRKLPDIRGLSNLEHLHLEDNLLTSVPKELLPNSEHFQLHIETTKQLEQGGAKKRVRIESEGGGGGSKE
jgi:Leucine-rich repeat (LRR) protein